MYVNQRFPHRDDAPAAARDVLDAVLAHRLSAEALAELRLVVSELVTNAVLHGRDRGGIVELTVTVTGDVARIDVTDGGGGFRPPEADPAPEELGGWGLVVVDRLASRWGVEATPFTRVWAEVPLASSGTNRGGPTAPVYARNV